MPGHFRQHGFTLIEMLVVVAIILILIATALPNYLDAKVRAHVTKVEAELVTVTDALEAYRTDWPRYPPDGSLEPTRFSPFWRGQSALRFSLMQLTTPTRYIPGILLDVFGPAPGEKLYDGLGYPLDWADRDIADGFPYIYYSAQSARYCPGFSFAADMMERCGFVYIVGSLGPDRDHDFEWLDPYLIVREKNDEWAYSPTNGTRSSGDLSRKKR